MNRQARQTRLHELSAGDGPIFATGVRAHMTACLGLVHVLPMRQVVTFTTSAVVYAPVTGERFAFGTKRRYDESVTHQ